LLKLHMATGLRKYLLRRKCKLDGNREAMIQEGQMLVNYASMNALAVRKILKKYDKVHSTKEGGLFQGRLLAMRSELLKSPYLVELGALHLNLSVAEQETISLNEMVGEFSCDFESSSPTLTCCLLGSAKLDFELTCSICLETIFDPVALGCGHIFCNSCACTAASVLAHEGPKTASCSAKCPLCRQAGVYVDAVRLKELCLLVKNRCPEYWKERLQRERKQQLKLAKQCYDEQLEILLGLRNSMISF